MSLAIETFTYAAMVILALSLLYLFGPLHWYWHALSVAVALVMGTIRMSAPGPLAATALISRSTSYATARTHRRFADVQSPPTYASALQD